MKRLSIPREAWVHTYIYHGQKKYIPTKKAERKTELEPFVKALTKFIRANDPCIVVGMGRLCAEIMLEQGLTATTILGKRVGTYWMPRLDFTRAGIDKVWITYSPEAALFDPRLVVSMSRVIGKAARECGIEIKLNTEIAMFDWMKLGYI